MSLSPAFLAELQIEGVILQARHPVLKDALSRAQAILTDGRLFPEEDGETATVLGSKPGTAYTVNGSCSCPASQYREEVCKHRLAWRLYKRVTAVLLEPKDAPAVDAPADIPAQFIVEIQGKQFVTYPGLLALAHQRGLVSLSARFISVDADVALAEATAVFADGKTFSEASDANPANVGAKVKAHFARMALTRAKARCLRDALNIALCSLEEVE